MTQIPHRPRAVAALAVLAILQLGAGAVAQSRQEAEAAVRDCLQSALDAQDFQVGELTVTARGDGVQVSGTTTLFGGAATLTGTLDKDGGLQQLEVEPKNLALKLQQFARIAGGGLRKRLPRGLPLEAGVRLQRLAFTRDVAKKKVETVRVGFAPTTATWRPFAGQPLAVEGVAVELSVLRPGDRDREVRGTVSGNLRLGDALALELTGQLARDPEAIELGAKVADGASFAQLARSLAGRVGQQILARLPGALANARLNGLEVGLRPKSKTATVRGPSSFGPVQFLAGPGGLMVGIAPPKGFKLGQLDPKLRSLDAGELDLSGLGLIVASAAGRVEQGLGNAAPVGAPVQKGLNLFARLDTRPIKLDRLLKVRHLDLRAAIPYPDPMGLVLTAAIRTDISLGRGARFKEVAFELRPSPRRFRLALSGKMDLRVQRDTLELLGEMGLEPLTQSVNGTFALDPRSGEWRAPFGLRGVGVHKLALSLGATFGAGIPLPTLGLQAGLSLGHGRAPLRGGGVVVLNPRDPMNSMVAMDVQQLSLMKIVDLAAPRAGATIRRSPLARSLAQMMVRKAAIRIVPNDIDFAGSRFEKGYRVAGEFRLLGVNAKGLFELDYTRGVSALATMDPIRIGNGAVVITGIRGRTRPVVSLDLRTDRQRLVVNGKIDVLRGMFLSETDLVVQPGSMQLYARGKVFRRLQAEVEMRASARLGNPRADFFFKARMEQTLLRDLRKKALAEIDRATRKHVRQIQEAKRKVAVEQAKVNSFSRQIAATRKRVAARQARDLKKMRDAASSARRKANKEYKRLGKLIKKKKKEIKKNPFKGVKLGPEIAWLETRRRVQRTVMRDIGANLTKGLAKIGKKFPKELSSELGPMIAGQKVAQGALAAAQGVLNGYKGVVTGTMGAARWIADNGLGGAFDLNLMQFQTRLSTARGSSFGVDLGGKFLGKPFTTQLRLDLRSPDRIAKDIARAFLNKRAPKRQVRAFRIAKRGASRLAPPRALPAMSAAQILARARAR